LARQAFFHDGLQILLAQDGIENSHFIDDADEERSLPHGPTSTGLLVGATLPDLVLAPARLPLT